MLKFKKMIVLIVVIFAFVSIHSLAYEPIIHDFSGSTINWAGQWGRNWGNEESTMYLRLKEVENKYNVKFNFVTGGPEYLERAFSTIIAGDAIGQYLHTFNRHLIPLAANNMLFPIEKIIDETLWEKMPLSYSRIKEETKVRGTLYSLPDLAPPFTPAGIIIWNKDLLLKEGLPNIYELIEKKEWTWEKMKEIVQALTRDTNGNGEIDQWGFGSSNWALPEIVSGLALLNNSSITDTVDGRLLFNGDSAGFIAALDFLTSIMDYTQRTDFANLFSEQKIGLLYVPLGDVSQVYLDLAEEGGFNLGISYLPLGEEGTEYFLTTRSVVAISLPVTVENPKQLADLWLALVSPNEMELELTKFIQDTAVDERAYNMLLEMTNNWVMDTYLTTMLEFGFRPYFNRVLLDGDSPLTVMNEIKPEMQAILDDLHN